MSKFKWSVSVKDTPINKPRHYKHVTQLYRFVLRNPRLFMDKPLYIFNQGKLVRETTYEEIHYRKRLGLTEGPERDWVRDINQHVEVN